MRKLLVLWFSLIWAGFIAPAFASLDIHTPTASEPTLLAKVYFLPDWREGNLAFDEDSDNKPCTDICLQKTQFDCAYGLTETYVNDCGKTCVRCKECVGCEEQGYKLSTCPDNGVCVNDCCNGLYKFTGCENGFVKEGDSCRSESCSENPSLCSSTQKCENGVCVDKDCSESPNLCGSNEICINKVCEEKNCTNGGVTCGATEKCNQTTGQCECSPTCVDESNCDLGTETIANGCGGTCTVCKDCIPTCVDESGCQYGTKTITNGCGGTCTVCKGCKPNCEDEWNCGASGFTKVSNGCGGSCRKCVIPTGAVIFTFSPNTSKTKLTIKSTFNYYGFNIDMGDGTVYKNLTTDIFSYTYAKEGTYDVTITGDIRQLGHIEPADKILKLKQFNLSNIEDLLSTFEGAVNMEGTIPHLPPNLKTVYYPFNYCSKLTGRLPSIPKTLVDATGLFRSCSNKYYCTVGFTGSIPELPSTLEDATDMFSDCKNVTGYVSRLPVSLKDVRGMFYNCNSLAGVETVNGEYPYQYLSNISNVSDMVYGSSAAVRQHFPVSWGGTCTTCE